MCFFWRAVFHGFSLGHLELLSGKFTFYKDRKSQLWLVDATGHRQHIGWAETATKNGG